MQPSRSQWVRFPIFPKWEPLQVFGLPFHLAGFHIGPFLSHSHFSVSHSGFGFGEQKTEAKPCPVWFPCKTQVKRGSHTPTHTHIHAYTKAQVHHRELPAANGKSSQENPKKDSALQPSDLAPTPLPTKLPWVLGFHDQTGNHTLNSVYGKGMFPNFHLPGF